MVFYTSCIYAFKLVFKSLSSLPSPFGVITGLELHWMGDGPAGTKEAENNAIWWFSRRTVLMTVPDSGATRVTVPTACGFDISYFSLSFYILRYSRQKKTIGDFCAFGLCMTSRHTRRNAQGELVTFTNQELARLERTNRQQPRQTDTTMGDHANQDDLAAAMALMQQQMQQMQQTIQAQQDAAEQAALAQQEQQAQTKEESDCSMKGNSSDAQKIDELTAKVDQLLKNNQGHVFSMEQATAGHFQNQNKRQPQSNQQAVPANENSHPDELQGLGMMMQQLLQGQQVQAKVLNQVTTEIDTRMGNMFTELNNKYDNLAIHMRKIDVQLAQTAESVKRQQETLPGRTDKNPRTEHCNAVEQPFAETILVAEENTEQSASSGVTGPSVPAETPPVRVYVPKVPYPIPPRHLMDPISEEQLIGFNKMVRRLPKELAFEDALQIRPLLQFFKHCRETQEEIKVLYIKALSTPALKVLPKVDDPGKFVFPCSIAGTTFKDALCDSEKLKVVPEKEHGDKGESRLFSDEDPSTDPTKFRGNSRVKQKVQKKRIKGDPTMTLIPLKCDENSIEYEVKCKGTSKPFSKVRAILTHELKEKGKAAGWRTRMVAKSEPPVALRTIMYYLLLRHITISVFKKKKKNEINVMEKGKKEKKHGATGKVEQEVGLELHWMGDGPAGTKEAENNAIWWFSRRTVLMTVPDSGATRPPVALIYHIFLFLFTFYAILDRRKPLETFVLLDCKGRRLHLSHHREDYPEPSFYLFYLHEVIWCAYTRNIRQLAMFGHHTQPEINPNQIGSSSATVGEDHVSASATSAGHILYDDMDDIPHPDSI
ncbi:hypothetical protein IGI04_002926 [Brassica rapa subsp. trilocularis]|uniref:Uncharacterized protein n=2 Tax=Brassica campestris TaxID=3711 RepID=A0ABQ7NWZ2_BRACM|nr:hypothetical protein IGI04_002926 [Brassica rapa subsp. trilocularis]